MFVFGQDEKYIHIDEMEMMKVEKCVSEVVEWMNNAVSAQAKKSLDQDPAVHSSEIKAKLQVSTIRNYQSLEIGAKSRLVSVPFVFPSFILLL